MKPTIRTSDVIAYFGGNHGEVGRVFNPPLSRQAVHQWPEFVPELRARQLLEKHPELQALVLDPETGRPRMEQVRGRLEAAVQQP